MVHRSDRSARGPADRGHPVIGPCLWRRGIGRPAGKRRRSPATSSDRMRYDPDAANGRSQPPETRRGSGSSRTTTARRRSRVAGRLRPTETRAAACQKSGEARMVAQRSLIGPPRPFGDSITDFTVPFESARALEQVMRSGRPRRPEDQFAAIVQGQRNGGEDSAAQLPDIAVGASELDLVSIAPMRGRSWDGQLADLRDRPQLAV